MIKKIDKEIFDTTKQNYKKEIEKDYIDTTIDSTVVEEPFKDDELIKNETTEEVCVEEEIEVKEDNTTTESDEVKILKHRLDKDILEEKTERDNQIKEIKDTLENEIKEVKDTLAEDLLDARPSEIDEYKDDANSEITDLTDTAQEAIDDTNNDYNTAVDELKETYDDELHDINSEQIYEDDKIKEYETSSKIKDYETTNTRTESSFSLTPILPFLMGIAGLLIIITVGITVFNEANVAVTSMSGNSIGTNVTTFFQTISLDSGIFTTAALFIVPIIVVTVLFRSTFRDAF